MSGTKIGADKARKTTLNKYGPDYYKEIGKKSWSNPNRSRLTGFALDNERAKEAGRRGGKKNKKEEYATAEEIAAILKAGAEAGDPL